MSTFPITNKKMYAEVSLLLVFFANMLSQMVGTNFVIYRTCYVILDYKESECALLGKDYSNDSTVELEKKVQPYAADILLTDSLIQAIFPPIICFFLGPWSDTYGRRPVLLLASGGIIISSAIGLILSAIPNASPWLLLLGIIPGGLTGGIPALLTVILCSITDVTTKEHRGLRMGIFEATIILGMLLGTISSSYVLNSSGYVTVYAVATACAVIAWLYIFLLIPETLTSVKTEGRLRNIFKISLVIAAIRTVLKKRENHGRSLLLITMLIMLVAVFAGYGNNGVIFLYLRRQFHWTLENYTVYSSVVNGVGIAGVVFAIFLLQKVLHLNEVSIILMGSVTALLSTVFQGLSTEDWQIYGVGLMKCLNGVIGPMARSFLSKLISSDDSGKLFCLLTALEATVAHVGSTTYTKQYLNCITRSLQFCRFWFLFD